jgi:hypothetical protein
MAAASKRRSRWQPFPQAHASREDYGERQLHPQRDAAWDAMRISAPLRLH